MQRYIIEVNGKQYKVGVKAQSEKSYQVKVDGNTFDVQVAIDDKTDAGERVESVVIAVPVAGAGERTSGGIVTEVRAPMPGVILSVSVKAGDRVEPAQQMVVLEAMKMKNPISSVQNAIVDEVFVQEGQSVAYNDLLLRFKEN